jgi:hypothetical protein
MTGLDWGDIPSWIAVILTIAIPLVAYLERNRIVSFVRRKAAEPLPALPPARFSIQVRPEGGWLLMNMGEGEAFNVQVHAESADMTVLSSGFWPRFLEKSFGTFMMRLPVQTMVYGDVAPAYVVVKWQDGHGEKFTERLVVYRPSDYKAPEVSFPVTDEGKVLPIQLFLDMQQAQPADSTGA